jgi:hypothetical protein
MRVGRGVKIGGMVLIVTGTVIVCFLILVNHYAAERLAKVDFAPLADLTKARLAEALILPMKESQRRSLEKFLRDYTGETDIGFENGQPTRYSAAFVDLKDDGTQEVIVYITGRNWCGSGGCVVLVLAPRSSSYRVVTKVTIARPPIKVLLTKSHGWHDIAVVVQGGGEVQPQVVQLSFDGTTYPNNPSMPPAKRLVRNIAGEVVVSSSTVGTLLNR